jgi:hypothetical protein
MKRGSAYVVEPSARIPCPTGDWAVDNGGPEEPKDETSHGLVELFYFQSRGYLRWDDTASLKGSTHHDLNCAGTETGVREYQPIMAIKIYQNKSWYRQKTISGMTGLPPDGAAITCFMPKFAMSPMKGPAVREYAKLYPQNIH